MTCCYALIRKLSLVLLSIAFSTVSFAQIYSFTDNTSGIPNFVNPNVTGTNLTLAPAGSAAVMATGSNACPDGFTTAGYIVGGTSFVAGVTKGFMIDITPATNYQLSMDSITIAVRRASSAPQKVGIAYSLNNGTSWTSIMTPFSLGTTSTLCGVMNNLKWAFPAPVVTTGAIKLAFCFWGGSSATAGLQVKNLVVHGTVTNNALPPCTAPNAPTNFQFVSVSPTQTNISYSAPVPAADSYLVVVGTVPALSAGPVNGTSYSVGAAIGGGTVMYKGTSPGSPITGLTAATDYYYHIFALRNNPGCSGGAAYSAELTGNDIQPVPVISQDPANDTGCTGTSASFSTALTTGTAYQYFYQWQTLSGGNWINVSGANYSNATSPTMTVNNVAGLSGQQYRCIVIGSAAVNDTSAAATLYETTGASFTAQPAPVTVCGGYPVFFEIGASGGNISYQWQVNTGSGFVNIPAGAPYAGQQTDSLSLPVTSTQNGYWYRCMISNPCGTIASDSVQLTIAAFPTVAITHITPLTFCPGDSVILNAPTGTGLSYQWFFNGSQISGATALQYTAKSSGVYKVRVSSTAGCNKSDSVTVTAALPAQPVITRTGLTLSTTTFNTYQWYRNSAVIPGATAQSYTATQNGSYQVEVSNGAGCKNISLATTIGGTAVPVTGLDEQLRLYPNPVRAVLNIDAPVAVNAVVRDMTGKVLLQQQKVQTLDLQGLAAGVYMLSLTTQDGGWVITRQIIKVNE